MGLGRGRVTDCTRVNHENPKKAVLGIAVVCRAR